MQDRVTGSLPDCDWLWNLLIRPSHHNPANQITHADI